MIIIIPCFLSQAKVLDQNAAEAKRARKVNQAQQKKKKGKGKEKTATEANATQTQPKLAPNKGLPAGYDPEVKRIPDEYLAFTFSSPEGCSLPET